MPSKQLRGSGERLCGSGGVNCGTRRRSSIAATSDIEVEKTNALLLQEIRMY